MNDLDDDEDEDERKPAARPSCTNVRSPSTESISSQQRRMKSTTNDSDFSIPPNGDINDDDTAVQSVAGEIPFLITHWLTGYSRSSCTKHAGANDESPTTSNTSSLLSSTEAQNAAIKPANKGDVFRLKQA